MTALIEPNIHPVLVHFAYALMTTAAISLLIVSFMPASKKRDTLKAGADWMIAFGALAVIATAAAGFQAYYSVAHDEPAHAAMTTHRNWAVPTAIGLLVLSALRWTKRDRIASPVFSLVFLAAAVSLSVTAWWGGRLVYGHGLGVESLPAVSGEGNDHDHEHGQEHSDVEGRDDDPMTHDHDDGDDHDDGRDHEHAGKDSSKDSAMAAPGAADAVEAFAAALKSGDEAAVRTLLLPDVVIAEGGGAERSLEEYAGHHLPADMAFMAAMNVEVEKRDALVSDDMATVVSESRLHGSFNDKELHLQMMESMVLKRMDDGWRIAHIHWSSAPIKDGHEH
ncbi:MAG: DUF2231 domain-containing protein [Parvularculaceae bacterium]